MNIAWIVFTLMVAVAAVGITIPLVRRYEARKTGPGAESAVLARELEEIDRQSKAEGAPEEVTAGLKAETVRRFLSETPAQAPAARPLGSRTLLTLGLGLAAVVAVAGTALYAVVGRPDMTGAPSAGADQSSGDAGAPNGHVGAMIAELEAKMRQSPNDPEGWRMLGWSYMSTGRYADAAGAYGRAAALDPANADYKSAQGEALVKAADGHVTPEAKAAFDAAYRLDATDPRARYFLAAAKDQAGDHEGAMNDWIALLKSAPPGAPWAADVRGFVVRIAAARGEDVTSRLPPPPPPGPSGGQSAAGGATPGPTEDQVAAAQPMSPAEQQAMVHRMVDGLAARLKSNPRDADGWVRLMRARMVLGDAAAAGGAYREAMKAFAGVPDQQATLTQNARQLGVPGA